MFDEKCEVCGEPATCAVRDYYKKMVLSGARYEAEPVNLFHWYCREHNRDAESIDISSWDGR